MPWGDPAPARLQLRGLLLTVVLLQVLRVWLPSLALVPSATGLSGPGITLAAGGALALTVVLAALRLTDPPRALAVTGLALVLARVVLQAPLGGWPQLVVATLGVLAGVLALAAWASDVEGHAARLTVFAGVVVAALWQLALGSLDLVWRHGPAAVAATVLLAVATGAAVLAPRPTSTDEADAAGEAPRPVASSAEPWLALGPAVALVLMLSAVPGRAAAATGWSPVLIAVVLAGGHALAVAAMWAAPRLGPGRCAVIGSALVMLGTAGALRPTSPLAVLAQVMVGVGVGLALGAQAATSGEGDRRGAAAGAAGAWLVTVLLLTGYHAWPELPTRLDSRYLLVGTAVLLGVLTLGGARGVAVAAGGTSPTRRAVTTTAAVATTALLAAVLTAATLPEELPAPAPVTDELTVVLLTTRLGHDARARFAPLAQADAVAGLGPHVVALTEVDRGWLLGGGHDTLRLLERRLGLESVFAPAGDLLRGHALLTATPLVDAHDTPLPRAPGGRGESLLTALIAPDEERRLAVLTTQLHTVADEPDVRRRQARAVAGEVARLRGQGLAVVLLGDLQAAPGDPELEPLEDLLAPAVPVGRSTWPAAQPYRQVDHILVSEELEVVDVDVVRGEVSDHLPVRVRLRLAAS